MNIKQYDNIISQHRRTKQTLRKLSLVQVHVAKVDYSFSNFDGVIMGDGVHEFSPRVKVAIAAP